MKRVFWLSMFSVVLFLSCSVKDTLQFQSSHINPLWRTQFDYADVEPYLPIGTKLISNIGHNWWTVKYDGVEYFLTLDRSYVDTYTPVFTKK